MVVHRDTLKQIKENVTGKKKNDFISIFKLSKNFVAFEININF